MHADLSPEGVFGLCFNTDKYVEFCCFLNGLTKFFPPFLAWIIIYLPAYLSVYLQSDPLGLNAAPTEGGDGNLGNGQRKRRGSEEHGVGPNTFKRPKVKFTVLQTT